MKIKDALTSLKDAYIDWDGFLLNPRYVQREQKDEQNRVLYQEITWDRRDATYRTADLVTEQSIIELSNASQYTFQVKDDGSIFQIYYNYDRSGNNIQSASLSFYLSRSHIKRVDEDTLLNEISVLPSENQDLMLDAVLSSVNNQSVGWIRIDYDPTAKERGIIHHDCHMHLSNFPDTRFIVEGIPSPRQFIEFVVATVYPSQYKDHCLSLEVNEDSNIGVWKYSDATRIKAVNSICISIEANSVYNQLSHFIIPLSS